jgi:hypothetical protein
MLLQGMSEWVDFFEVSERRQAEITPMGFALNDSTSAPATWLRLGCDGRIDLPRLAEMRSLNHGDLSSTGASGSLGVRGSNPLSSTISSSSLSVAPALGCHSRGCARGHPVTSRRHEHIEAPL